MSNDNNFPVLLQRHSFTSAGTCAYRSSHFPAGIETGIQAAVRVIAHDRKLIDTTDIGISREHNLAIGLRRHAVAEGATIGGDGCATEGDNNCACLEGEESLERFHFSVRNT